MAFCLSCGTYKQEVNCLSFLGSANILNKFLPSERGESHTVEAAGLSLRCLWCPSERADNDGLLHLNSFNWRVDVTSCRYFLVITVTLCELRLLLKMILFQACHVALILLEAERLWKHPVCVPYSVTDSSFKNNPFIQRNCFRSVHVEYMKIRRLFYPLY